MNSRKDQALISGNAYVLNSAKEVKAMPKKKAVRKKVARKPAKKQAAHRKKVTRKTAVKKKAVKKKVTKKKAVSKKVARKKATKKKAVRKVAKKKVAKKKAVTRATAVSRIPRPIDNLFKAVEGGDPAQIRKTIEALSKAQLGDLIDALPWSIEAGERVLAAMSRKGGEFQRAATMLANRDRPPLEAILKCCFEPPIAGDFREMLLCLCDWCKCCDSWPCRPPWICRCCYGAIRVYPKSGADTAHYRCATSLKFTGAGVQVSQGDSNYQSLIQIPGGGGAGPHAASHQPGGGDVIDVTGLSGELAAPQIPKAHALASHNDVSSAGIAVGKFLKWDGGAWVPADPPAGGVVKLDDVGDVNATAPANRQVLAWDMSGVPAWTAQTRKRVVTGQVSGQPGSLNSVVMPDSLVGGSATNTCVVASGYKTMGGVTTPLAVKGTLQTSSTISFEVWDINGQGYNPAAPWDLIVINYAVIDK
jgi:hypothetical protein